MKRIDLLDRKIERHLRKEQLFKSQEYANLERPYLAKSRKNFTIANLLFRISENDDVKKLLSLASGFEMFEWVIIVSYYSMYASALAAISRLGFKSKSHAATIVLLERFYVQENALEQKHLHNLARAYALSGALISKLIQTKIKRETAQYDATPAISRENAVSAMRDADEFITKVEEILGK
ncbi:hypothetical protein MUO65_08605 [bacterium]|nr:hypothetical protein [bacterium]